MGGSGAVEGWVVGAFGEASPALHKLVDLLGLKGAVRRYAELGVDNPLRVTEGRRPNWNLVHTC